MLLQSLKLQGYKTFAGKTDFEFAGAITCIVGPNGSGKSNIADSIRWVLGEQSYRLLRGKKTDDMIFAGSEHRPRASMASSTITFDNTNGWLPIDFSEVSITRRAYRDGNNEYLLNGQRVRLRDISELLGNSGLSERTYTIIGQGLVDATLALKADERRLLFEEAAGIGLYRTRRDESQKRLETTFRNLERVEDILAELKPRLRSLERQSRRAAEYEQINTDLQMLLRDYYGYHWYRAQRELSEARENGQVQESLLEAIRQEQSELDQKLSGYRDAIQGLRARLGSWHREMAALHSQREEITRDLAVSDERVRSLTTQEQNALDEISRLEIQIAALEERIAETDKDIETIKSELTDAQIQIRQAQEKLNSQNADRKKAEGDLQKASEQLADLRNRQTQQQIRRSELETRLDRRKAALIVAVQAVDQAKDTLNEAENRVQKAQQAFESITGQLQKADEALRVHRIEISNFEEHRKKLFAQRSEQQAVYARIKAQLDVLEQADSRLVGYSSGAQLILKSVQEGKLKGSKGAFSSQLDVPEEFEIAVGAALGEYVDAVLVDSLISSENALEILMAKATRGVLLPIESLIPSVPIKIPSIDGVFGLASALVRVPVELRPAVDLLLGQTIVVENREIARSILVGQPLQTKVVTLRGEVFLASGPVLAGSSGTSSTLSRPRQRREYQDQLTSTESRISNLEQMIKELDQKLAVLESTESELVQALAKTQRQERTANDAKNHIRMELERARRQEKWQREQKAQLESEIQQDEKELSEFSEALLQLETKISDAQQTLRVRQSALANLSAEEFQQQISHWNTQAAVASRALDDAQARRNDYQANLSDAIQTKRSMLDRKVTYFQGLGELNTKIESLRLKETELVSQVEKLQLLIEPSEVELQK
ncbi:MAG: AAA family ATPase, partial [Anaerolineales bacterium]